VLFAGTTFDAARDLPSMAAIADGMLRSAERGGHIPPELGHSLRVLLEQGEAATVIEGIVETGEQGTAHALAYLKQVIPPSKPSALTQPVHDLGFSGAIAAGFDSALQAILSRQPATIENASALLEALGKGEFFFLSLYGRLEQLSTVLLTPGRYRDAVHRNQLFGQFLKSLFHSRTLLFAGSDLKRIEEFLESVPTRTDSPPEHFALIPTTESGWKARAASLRRRFGLEIITFDFGMDRRGLAACLSELARQVRARREQGARTPAGLARLAKVTLSNIGPFDHLEIDLHAGWNVLLGDNGVGKSSVLKAIAAAIAGEEAAPYAARLIRGGASSASVQLTTTSGETYVLDMLRSESGARLQSLPVRPLEKEGWLALAFPPLRTVSWERPEAYEGWAQNRPTSSDLLPLCHGQTDPRLNRLKSWLLWLDHTIASSGDLRYVRLRDEFYRLVGDVTPGLTLKQGTVDAEKRQVFVRTDDGEVPIEGVSQGTQSLMGWIGIVLQRLFEVYTSDDDPTRRQIVVLMDEIDAHMHPHWQQLLVGKLKHIFPNAQFIVTSHSPLIIAGLSRHEILVFRRDQERRVRVDRPVVDPKGWRVDQILTSLAFGLEGARDPGTIEALQRFTTLVAEDVPTDPQELASLGRELDLRIPTAIEREHARKAFEIMSAFAEQQLARMSPTDRSKVIEELKVQIQEGLTGSRRPM
jgi:hypothetical protein